MSELMTIAGRQFLVESEAVVTAYLAKGEARYTAVRASDVTPDKDAAGRKAGTSVNLPELRDRLDSSGPVGTAGGVEMAQYRNAAETPKERLIADQADVTHPVPAAPGVRDTSKDALAKHRGSGKLTRQQTELLELVRANPARDWTRQELVIASKMPINVVTGRCHELLHEPFCHLVETSKRRCRVTGETAMAIRLGP